MAETIELKFERKMTCVATLAKRLQNGDEMVIETYYVEAEELERMRREHMSYLAELQAGKAYRESVNTCKTLFEMSLTEPVKSVKPILDPFLDGIKDKCTFNIIHKEDKDNNWKKLKDSIDNFKTNDEIAAGTINLGYQQWKAEELKHFDKAIADAEKTIGLLDEKLKQAEKEGRKINKDDLMWLKKIQIASPTGYRNYDAYPEVVKMTIDNYESKFNSGNYRDAINLLMEGCMLKGTGHVNTVLFQIEKQRVSEFKDLLLFNKALGDHRNAN